MEVIQDSRWTRRALEVLWRMVADVEDTLDHGRMQGRWGVFPGGGAAPQNSLVVWWGGEQALDPLLHPVVGAPDLVSVLLVRPGGIGAQQFAQMGAVSHELCFFHAADSKHEN